MMPVETMTSAKRKASGAVFRRDQHGSVAAILCGRAWVQNEALVDSRSGLMVKMITSPTGGFAGAGWRSIASSSPVESRYGNVHLWETVCGLCR